MATVPLIDVEILLVESGGSFGKVGVPHLFCRFRAVHCQGISLDDGCINVVAREQSGDWREYTQAVTVQQSTEIVELLNGLGLPGRKPDAEGVVDTSDGWTHLFLRVRDQMNETVMDLPMHSSGFNGADADRLRVLFRKLFALARYERFSPGIYGP
jgi:hypothetical protein